MDSRNMRRFKFKTGGQHVPNRNEKLSGSVSEGMVRCNRMMAQIGDFVSEGRTPQAVHAQNEGKKKRKQLLD